MNKSKISIVIITLGRQTLYKLIDKLLFQKIRNEYEIVLVPQNPLKEDLLKDKRIKIRYEPLNKGVSYYRNIGIKHSEGDIIVFIDDDEIPIDDCWLKNLTEPITKGNELVTTAGTFIPLGHGYLTDSISLLGFPGGGAIGFKTMWKVDNNNYTDHLCSGNFAIDKKIILDIGMFSEDLKIGNEDVNLADKINKNEIKIKYIEEATIYHIARKGLKNFINWNLERGKSAKQYLEKHDRGGKITERIKSSLRILYKVTISKFWYLPGVLFVMFNQYLWQTIVVMKK